MLGLIKDQAALLNQLSHNTLIFQLTDHSRKFLHRIANRIETSEERTRKHQKQ